MEKQVSEESIATLALKAPQKPLSQKSEISSQTRISQNQGLEEEPNLKKKIGSLENAKKSIEIKQNDSKKIEKKKLPLTVRHQNSGCTLQAFSSKKSFKNNSNEKVQETTVQSVYQAVLQNKNGLSTQIKRAQAEKQISP